MKKQTFLSFLFIFLISLVSIFDLFFQKGRPATFDGPTHMTDIAGYSQALLDRNFPVFWLDRFGNYGMPVGFFSHQLPLTLAGGVNIFLHNPVFTFYLFFFLGIFLTNSTFYLFLRIYFLRLPSLLGIFLLTFSPYRITNIYIRGDMPETFSGVFLGLILLGIYALIVKNKPWGFFLISISYFCLAITHPMMLLIYAFFIIPYLLYLLFRGSDKVKNFFLFVFAVFIGIGMGAYFLLPLFLETKYLYFGLEKNHLSPQFLSLKNFFGENWFYFYHTDIFTRGQFIQIGSIEFLTMCLGVLATFYALLKKNIQMFWSVPCIALCSGLVALFFMTVFANPLYQHISFLTSIQFPWRFLAVFIFFPPILVASFFQKIRNLLFVFLFIFLIAVIRFPQLYGKNDTFYPVESYYFTPYNLFPIFMNTIWTGKTEEYPIEKQKIGIITGKGTVLTKEVHNASREYVIDAQSSLRLVDYTFYFPGWHVYVDGVDTPIEFQDPAYRGVITYTIPSGKHTVEVILQDTFVRKFAKILSGIFIFGFFGLFICRKKLFSYIRMNIHSV